MLLSGVRLAVRMLAWAALLRLWLVLYRQPHSGFGCCSFAEAVLGVVLGVVHGLLPWELVDRPLGCDGLCGLGLQRQHLMGGRLRPGGCAAGTPARCCMKHLEAILAAGCCSSSQFWLPLFCHLDRLRSCCCNRNTPSAAGVGWCAWLRRGCAAQCGVRLVGLARGAALVAAAQVLLQGARLAGATRTMLRYAALAAVPARLCFVGASTS